MWGIIIFAVVAFLAYHFLKGYNSESKKVKESFKNQNSNYQEEEVPAVEPLDISFEESNKEEGKYLVVDTETTGLPTDRYFEYTNVEKFPRIIQLAWMLLDDEFKVINNDSFYINPGVSVPPEATRVNGITTAMIRKEGITPKEAYAKFLNDANRAKVLVAHNADFDVNMIKSELYRNGFGEPLKHYIYCTMFNTSQFVKYNNKRNLGKYPKLSELAGWLFYENTNLSFKGLHNAENDTAITAKCFIELHNRGYIEDYLFEPSILSGDMLKPDFKNVINKENPFYTKKVVFDGFSEKELRTVVAEVKLLGADIDLTVGKNTNLLITGDRVDSRKLATMRLNIEAGKDARMMDIAECRRIIKQYINELNT